MGYTGQYKLAEIQFEAYKSFKGKETHAIDLNSNINLIIGRNNSGKSSLIDVIGAVFGSNQENRQNIITWGSDDKNDKFPQGIQLSFFVDREHLAEGFSMGTNIYGFGDLYSYSERYIGGIVKASLESHYLLPETFLDKNNKLVDIKRSALHNNWSSVMEKYSEDISLLRFHRINAERDIIPEYESDNAKVEYNGDNLTNLIGMYINRAGLSEEIVEKTILEELNKIMGKDAHFTGIRVQEIDEKDNIGEGQGRYKWEIFLEENGKRYSLSKSGSGLKTIIMVLVNLYLIPMTEECNSADIVYAFEELENNLHPALQRRLFEFLYRYSIENGVRIFLTSHSPVAINTFYGRDNTNIYHVTKDDSGSHLLRIMCGEKAQEVLYDLGVKASDLFQTNGIIWVEGPSDRIYIKKWVEIIGGADIFTEGQDYQFMFYGGRLLSHLSAKPFDEKEEDELIKLLTVNHNAVLVMDSDKTDSESKINKTKQRIKKELEDNGCICWVTAGKEIENYISHDAINKAYNADLKQIPQYEDFSEYISEYNKTYGSNKVVGARHICEYIDKDNYDAGFDLREKIEDIIKAISKWNKDEKD